MADDDVDIDPWDRQPGETPKRYAQFLVYLELGEARTLAAVAQQLTRNASYVRQVSAEWHWVARAGAWDQLQYQERAARIRAERREADDRHVRLARALQTKVVAALQAIDPNKVSAGELTRMLEVAVKVERLGLGAATDAVQHTGPDAGPIQLQDLTREERDARLAALTAELVRRRAAQEAGQVTVGDNHDWDADEDDAAADPGPEPEAPLD